MSRPGAGEPVRTGDYDDAVSTAADLLHPTSKAEVVDAVRSANAEGRRLLIVGGRTHIDKGNPSEVDAELWTLIRRLKPAGRLLLVSDAVALAGTDTTTGRLGSIEVEVADGRVTLAGTTTLAGSVLSLDDAVRRLVETGASLSEAVRAASQTPLELLGVEDRGRLEVGQRADLVELDDALNVRGVWLAGRRLDA